MSEKTGMDIEDVAIQGKNLHLIIIWVVITICQKKLCFKCLAVQFNLGQLVVSEELTQKVNVVLA